jgi:hypothetical protein
MSRRSALTSSNEGLISQGGNRPQDLRRAAIGSLTACLCQRNVVIGPRFDNVDFSITKNMKIGERVRAQLRAEFFDLFNHANLGQPGNIIGTLAFGRISTTRFPTGESGSSRQVQFAMKMMF